MNKKQLIKVLAEIVEESVKIDMCKQVGCSPGADQKVLGLAALRMMHDICATGFEKGAQAVLPKYGYEVVGFRESLQDPTVDEAVTMCLTEIAAESDVLQHIKSPYVRLTIAWGGALVTSIRKTRPIINHAAPMGPRSIRAQNPVQSRPRRRSPPREDHVVQPPSDDDEKTV